MLSGVAGYATSLQPLFETQGGVRLKKLIGRRTRESHVFAKYTSGT